MGHKIHPEAKDYAQLEEINPLVSAFSRAVQHAVAHDPVEAQKVHAAKTSVDDDVLKEIHDNFQSFADHLRYYKADQGRGINNLLTFSIKNHFMQVVRRAVSDDKLAVHVPASLATDSNADLLDKYKLRDLASVVRLAATPAVKPTLKF